MMVLQQRWSSNKWRRPSGGSAAQGGEGEGEARLPRGSNGGVGGAHHEDELAVALLCDFGAVACFSHRRRMRGNGGEVVLTPCLRRRKGGGKRGASDIIRALLKGSCGEWRNIGGRGAARQPRGTREVGDGPGSTGRWWVVGTGPATPHAGAWSAPT
jgi:hypothetical protein